MAVPFLHAGPLALALGAEAALGYPDALYRAVRHPVVWIGALIALLDRALNREAHGPGLRRALGVLALAVLLGVTLAATLPLALWLRGLEHGWAAEALLAATLLAQRSLDRHVAAVREALRDSVEAGRRAVSHIVGRDPAALDEAGVARAAVESLAENYSDGVVAPAFWLLVGGLPGIALYKAVNTADSMIGHRTPRHEAFGWAAARLDDLVNLPGSRLAAGLLALAALLLPGASARGAVAAVASDARRHRSPNAGWPEAATAGALGLRLAGPRTYGGVVVDDHWMGRGRAELGPDDIGRALALVRTAEALMLAGAAALALA
ncbi:MAG TPA: adenosylcobinamide-phosphate synthase CbiB [Azospirillaceae bacterium]|nr:adenosylcobinamide-phosphate synthase CbiB [Azospirillaceae bacterium]